MEEKRNFFKNVWTSIKDFEKYEEFAADKLLQTIKYILILTLLFTAIISLTYTYKFYTILRDVRNYVSENIEEMSFKDGKLNIAQSEPIVIENEDNIAQIVIIDTSEDANEEEELKKIDLYGTGILFLSDRIIISSEYLNGNETMYYSDAMNINIENKEEFVNLISGNNATYSYIVFCITILIYLFVVYFTSNLIDGIVLGVLGYLFARVVKLKLKFLATFNIGIHALTLPIVLNLIYIIVNTLTGFEVSYFQWMYTSISYVYVAVAILMIKTEIINQKIQLIRLEKIQEQVKEETLQEENPDKEEKEKEEEPDQKKEKKKNEGAGEEPEGSNA